MDEAVAGAEEVDEGAEVDALDHGSLVDRADFRLGGDALDPSLALVLERESQLRGAVHQRRGVGLAADAGDDGARHVLQIGHI